MSRTSSTFGKRTHPTLSASPISGGTEQPVMRRSGSANNLRKSTGNMAASLGALSLKSARGSNDLDRIESEYIKNLQQQVYFLELEANYLREQARKATDMHPQMTSEAERMLGKLRHMQSQMDDLSLEVKRKQANIEISASEQEKLLSRLKADEGYLPTMHRSKEHAAAPAALIREAHVREKRMLLEEIVQLKKEKDIVERDCTRRDGHVLHARDELDKSSLALRNAETKIGLLKNQLEQKEEQLKLLQGTVDEKRLELMKTETMLREVEDKYYSSTTKIQEKTVTDLRTEITVLGQKLKEAELSADHDRYLRQKLSDDSSRLVKENAIVNQQLSELTKQLALEKELRASNDSRRAGDISELVSLRDSDKQLRLELEQARAEARRHQDQCSHLLGKLSQQEKSTSSTSMSLSTMKSKVAECESMLQGREADNTQLKRDKSLLVDHVADLQRQMNEKERELLTLHAHVHQLETQIKEVEHLKGLESSLHSQKWDEFSRLADSMKTLSRSLATSKGRDTPTSSQLLTHA